VRAGPLLDLDAHPIIGHRGASGAAPENTLAAFDLALAQQADALELDVRLTADGVPVAIHDATLDRTTDRAGAVANLPLVLLQEADAGARFTADGARTFPFRGCGVRVPALREVLERYPETPLLIELKVAEAQLPVRDLTRAAEAEVRCVLASLREDALRLFREPPFRAAASRRAIVEHAVRAWLRWPPRDRGFALFAVPLRYLDRLTVPTPRFVATARHLGRPVHVWTVNQAATAEQLWAAGVSGMITNYPAMLRAARDRWTLRKADIRPC